MMIVGWHLQFNQKNVVNVTQDPKGRRCKFKSYHKSISSVIAVMKNEKFAVGEGQSIFMLALDILKQLLKVNK